MLRHHRRHHYHFGWGLGFDILYLIIVLVFLLGAMNYRLYAPAAESSPFPRRARALVELTKIKPARRR